MGQNEKLNFYEFLFCTNCDHYDGYDLCCHSCNWGTVTTDKIKKCKENNWYYEK